MLRQQLNTRILVLLAILVSLAFSSSPASAANAAGTYTIYECTTNVSQRVGYWDGYEITAGATPYFWNTTDCTTNGFVRRFQPTTIAGGASDALTYIAPPDTYLAQTTLYQVISPRSAGAYDAVYANLDDGTRQLVASYIPAGGDVGEATYDLPSNGSHHTVSMRTELGCQAAVANCAGTSGGNPGNQWTLSGATMTVVDPYPPSFSSVGGTGWTAEPADGVSTIDYTAADKGSGLTAVRLLVDGIQVAEGPQTCEAGRYQPCSLSASGQFSLDTTRLSEGQHTVSLVGVDYANNVGTPASQQLTITVRRAPQVSSSSPVSTSDPSANGGGSPAVGDQIGGNGGSWAGDGITYTYQWMRCDSDGANCAPIDGATGLSYTAAPADLGHALEFCVTAANSGGSSTSCSTPTPAVVAAHPAGTNTTGGSNASVPSTGTNSSTSTSSSQTIGSLVDRGAPNGSPASERVVLTATSNNRSSTRRVKFGKRVPISGRLVGTNGAPISGAVITVQVQTAVAGASMADAAQVVTGRDGRFTYTAPAGPSRVIRFAYRAYTADTSFADTTDVRLLVSAGVTMKATPKQVHNKKATVFKGHLLGRPINRRGVVVDLQVFFRNQWRTFAAPRTNRAGVYKFKYRFMAGAATWKFRARVRKDSSYPYELGYSAKPIKVRVVN